MDILSKIKHENIVKILGMELDVSKNFLFI